MTEYNYHKTTVSLDKRHKEFLDNQERYNLSRQVRNYLDEEIEKQEQQEE